MKSRYEIKTFETSSYIAVESKRLRYWLFFEFWFSFIKKMFSLFFDVGVSVKTTSSRDKSSSRTGKEKAIKYAEFGGKYQLLRLQNFFPLFHKVTKKERSCFFFFYSFNGGILVSKILKKGFTDHIRRKDTGSSESSVLLWKFRLYVLFVDRYVATYLLLIRIELA